MSNSSPAGLTCPNPDCRIAETGKCVEGFTVGECPHQKAATTPPEKPDLEANSIEPVIEMGASDVLVASGDILTIDEATDVLCSGPTRVLAVIGPLDAGKTTFGVELYAAFQDGPFDRWSFGGSLTLTAFEKRGHLARAACGKTSPDTPRTSMKDGLGFLHLAVHSDETGRVNLLISDRSGEYYTAVADNQEDCENLHEIPRADLVLFLVDGEKLASDERHGVKSDIAMMVETLVEGGLLGGAHRVGIVLTKYDLVLSSGVTGQAEMDFDTLVANLQTRFGSTLAEINAFRIAARPKNDTVEPRFGVLTILEECMRSRRCIDFVPSTKAQLDRWFFRLPVAHGGVK
jgi:hypothetical protein